MGEIAKQEERRPMRETAQITSIKELITGEYIVQEGWLPNYVQTASRKLTRVNIIGIVVEKQTPFSFKFDDGTGTILVNDFSHLLHTQKLVVGKPVLVIGKPRMANEQLFIASEIITYKQLEKDPNWVQHRKEQLLELERPITIVSEKEIKKQETTTVTEPVMTSEPTNLAPLSGEDVIEFIKSKDSGQGCSTDEITEYFGTEVEEHITTLLTMGEVFEIRPGFVKVLE